MVSLTDLGIEENGILQPALNNRWKIRFPLLDTRNVSTLTQQTNQCKLDLLSKTLKVKVEQSILGFEYDQILVLADHSEEHRAGFSIHIGVVDGIDDPIHILQLLVCKLISHEVTFEYTVDTKVLYHELEFKFKRTDTAYLKLMD